MVCSLCRSSISSNYANCGALLTVRGGAAQFYARVGEYDYAPPKDYQRVPDSSTPSFQRSRPLHCEMTLLQFRYFRPRGLELHLSGKGSEMMLRIGYAVVLALFLTLAVGACGQPTQA